MTCCSQTSFESRLSERNDPPGSDKSPISFQNSASDSRSGSLAPFDSLRSLRAGAELAAGGGGSGAGAAAGGGAGAAAGGACFAQEIGPVATSSARNPAQRHRPDIFTNR